MARAFVNVCSGVSEMLVIIITIKSKIQRLQTENNINLSQITVTSFEYAQLTWSLVIRTVLSNS